MLACGFTFIVPSLVILLISTIAAVIATLAILSSASKANAKIIKWWIVPPVALTMVVVSSYICS